MLSETNVFSLALGIGCMVFFAYGVEAQSIPKRGNDAAFPGSVDCSKINIQYADDTKLTKAEKIALMDKELLRSLSKFDDCKISKMNSSNDEENSSSNGLEQNTGGGSVASSDMSGTDKPLTQDQLGTDEGVEANANLPVSGNRNKTDNGSPSGISLDNGKIPEDLINADNDSVLQAQIRQAAINEKDPKLKAKLWNEYRKYKGKPQVE